MADREFDDAQLGWDQGRLQRFNLAVLGATGVGKSTLVNAVFGEDVARTGIGEPVTKGVNFYLNRAQTLGLYDSEGAESFSDLEAFVDTFKKIYDERLRQDPTSAIHGVWFCVRAGDRRFDERQASVVRRLAGMGLPVCLVVTQTPWRPGYGIAPDARALLDHIHSLMLPIVGGRPIPVSALDDDFHGTSRFGLDHLLKVTFDAAPVGVRTAFASAQRIDAQLKSGEAKKVVAKAVAVTAGIAATPIPVADAPILVAAQFGMLRQLSGIYGVEVPATALAGALAGGGATLAGRSIVSGLLKFVPVAGLVINAGVAGGLTWVLGQAWAELCERHWRGQINLDAASRAGQLAPLLNETLKQWAARRPKA